MRIAWFCHRYHPCIGGSETFSREIVRRFVAAGDGVDVITSDAYDLWYFTDSRRRRVDGPQESWIDGAHVRRFAVRHFPLQRYVGRALSYVPHWPTRCRSASYMPILPGIERVRGDYDLVFALGYPFTIFSFAALRTARAAGAPLILTPFLHLGTPGDIVNRNYTKPHQVRLLREASLVVVQTNLERAAVLGWGIPTDRIHKLGMAVRHDEVTSGDGARFRASLGIPRDAFVVGQLGANDPNKGTNDLVRAVSMLNEQRAGAEPIRLVLAGARSPDFDAFVARLGPNTNHWLTILGILPEGQRASFYAALDVFAMPSRTDSFGIVFLEAWANGLPVIGAAAGGVAEVIEHGRTGFLVPFGDAAALAQAVDKLFSDRALAGRLGDAGRALVSAGHSWDDKFADFRAQAVACLNRRQSPTPKPGWRSALSESRLFATPHPRTSTASRRP
jgi:glycosyltransferase involved in cell wall biosynthesis